MGADTHSLAKPGRKEAPYANRTIALVGLMGAGKSTVGKRLADALGRTFRDSDDEIEKAAGLSVSDIFAIHGEPEFRRGERRVLERLLAGTPHVLATGGGAFLDPNTRALMREQAVTVWLNADLDTLWKRVQKRDTRPLLRVEDPRRFLERLMDERSPIYAQADLSITSADGPHRDTVQLIIDALETWTPQ
ncbi:MAG: shikimate kinase [Pseudomonadota bacterium]